MDKNQEMTVFTVNGVNYKLVKEDETHVWGAKIVNQETGKCGRGRPSKFERGAAGFTN